VDEVKSNDYYEIIRSIALLNRNELLEFRKRFKLAIEKSINEEINLPYRIALPRLDCGFVFIPYPYKESGSTLIALENFTKAHKYDQRLGKCIGVIVRKEIGAPYFEIYWSLIEHEWKYDDLLEDHLLKNFPFRETKAVLKSKY